MTAAAIKDTLNTLTEDWAYVGIRFENANRSIGDPIGNSRHNPDRLDGRDFPEYGTTEYDDLPELDGTSVWLPEAIDLDDLATGYRAFPHVYIVGGWSKGNHDDPDDGEILIRDAAVLAKIA